MGSGMEAKNLVKLRGQLESVTYENEENSYVVAKVRVYGYADFVTIVGNIPSPTPGEILDMSGEWHSHPKFGDQFKVVFCSCSVPASVYGIEKYLGSGLIRGLGPVMAKRIVKIFGEKTLDVIEQSVEKLLVIEGIGRRRIEMIAKAWIEQKEVRSVMVFLQGHGISSAYASKIYKKYGNDSIAVIKENPYRLAQDIFGIGFLTADKIAQKLGFDEQSPQRAEAGIMYVMYELTNEGHVYYPRPELIAKAKEMLSMVDDVVLETAMESLLMENKIVIENLRTSDAAMGNVFITGYHAAEIQTAKMLMEIRDTPKNTKKICDDTALAYTQKKLSIKFATNQNEAVRAAIKNKLLVITGGPGTGKTTITKAILEIFSLVTDKILLAAPTGRAAKRMFEATGREAKTIHRLLEFDPSKKGFKRDENNRLNCDLIILDEASMIDILLMYHLLRAIPPQATLVLVGDVNQLPSVGAGSVLKDVINSKAFSVVRLNEIFRQAQRSSIIVNAHKIISGQYPLIDNSPGADFYFLREDEQEKVLDKVLGMVKERIPKKFGYNPLSEIQVLTPMNRGMVGTAKINESLQDAINPHGAEIIRGGRRYRVGDKVMQIRNNYDKNVFNGDMGQITDMDSESQTLSVNIDGREINYEYSELDELTLAYAVSIHKSQGSEYPAVVLPLVMGHYVMLQRNLLYTGITRGKKLVVVIGSKKAMFIAVNNNKIATRNSWLCERLVECGGNDLPTF
ncbi:MAG: ATP-dependent RecD-like DNA helicase [Holosporaceae bacterium]|jgi:exodeoxyribonuclease V alpha subunit|nr:ATP-dependent RecD-like DNA helicase [Holosporaceae bacterium]